MEAATAISEVERRTVEHTEALQEVLRPHRLALNVSKSQSLVAVRGRGAYADAARVFGGAWTGPPIKQSVKYLGARIDAQLSLRLEITKRIAAARSSFSLFARFFRNSHVSQLHKTRVFKAVINEVLLAALEVRALSTTDVQRLESARGMMLRRLFGKRGFGAVFGEEGHRAVPRTVLKELTGLVEIGVELRTRRLLWLRSALAAENGGELRLDLAALFWEDASSG